MENKDSDVHQAGQMTPVGEWMLARLEMEMERGSVSHLCWAVVASWLMMSFCGGPLLEGVEA